ncbi:pentapeptide repeat-containing protein [Micromonospora chersina]
MKESVSSLKRRWRSDAGQELALAVQGAIRDNRPLDGLGLAEVNGRVDLRFIPLAAEFALLSGVHLESLDLSGAMASNLRLVDSEIRDCVFGSAECRYWHLQNTLVRDCSFTRADLRDSTLGEWRNGRGNRYSRTNFAFARLQRSTTRAAIYEDCDFSNAQLDKVNFWQSTVIRCRFAGKLRDVIFDGRNLGEGKPDINPMQDVDFSEAHFDGCEFRGVNFASIRLPPDPDLLLVKDSEEVDRAIMALDRLAAGPDTDAVHMALQHAAELLDFGGEALLNARDVGVSPERIAELLPSVGRRG